MADIWGQYPEVTPPNAAAIADPWAAFPDADKQPSMLEIVGNRIGHEYGLAQRNLIQGELSLPATIANIPGYAYNFGADLLQGKDKGYRFPDQRKAIADLLTKAGLPQPQNPAERVAGDIEGAVGGAATGMGLGGLLSGSANPTAQGIGATMQANPGMQISSAASGAGAGGITREAGGSPLAQLGATVLGSLAPPTGVALGRSLLDSLTPDALSPENVRLLNASDRLGVDIRPGQAMGRGALKTADEELSRAPLTGYNAQNALRVDSETQRGQFNAAVSRTFGENDEAITPAVIARAHRRLGQVYDTVLPRNSVAAVPNDPVATDLNNIRQAADGIDAGLAAPDRGRVANAVNYVTGLLQQPGGIPGRVYQQLRGQHGLIGVLENDDNGAISHYGTQIRNALDHAFERQAQGNDAALLQDANAQYRNLMVVRPLAAKAADGNISPALLLNSVVRHYPNFASQGAGDIGDLAQIGQLYLKPPPNSGTAERSLILSLTTDPIDAAKKAAAIPFSSTIGRSMNMGINSARNRNALLGQLMLNPTPLNAYRGAAPGMGAALLNQNTGGQ